MHILFTIANDSYVPYFNWFARKAMNYPEIKFSFLCLYPTKPKMIEDMKAYGCEVHWVEYDEAKRKSGILKSIPKVYSIIKKIKPDVVHSHLFDDALISLTAAKFAGVKLRAITKGDACYHYFYTPQWMVFDKLNNSLATHVVAVSGENYDFIVDKEGAPKSKMEMIHHGIPKEDYMNFDDTKIQAFKDKFDLEGHFVFGSVGRLEKNKGMLDVIKAAKQLTSLTDQKFKVLITGEGAEKESLLSYINENNLQDIVTLTGWVDEGDIPNLFKCFDVYVHASHFETFGFVIAEAMMYGLPVIATKTSGAAKDAITSIEDGILFDYQDIDACAKGMHELMSSDKINNQAIQTKGETMFEFNVMWNNHINLYKKSLKIKD